MRPCRDRPCRKAAKRRPLDARRPLSAGASASRGVVAKMGPFSDPDLRARKVKAHSGPSPVGSPILDQKTAPFFRGVSRIWAERVARAASARRHSAGRVVACWAVFWVVCSSFFFSFRIFLPVVFCFHVLIYYLFSCFRVFFTHLCFLCTCVRVYAFEAFHRRCFCCFFAGAGWLRGARSNTPKPPHTSTENTFGGRVKSKGPS